MKKIIFCSLIYGTILSGGFFNISQASTSISQTASDALITTKIKAKYTANPILNPFDIQVTTTNGIVTLQGHVNTDIQLEKASALAFSTTDVQAVRASGLKTRNSKRPLADIATTAKVLALLLKNNYIANENSKVWNVRAETKNGDVYITGEVKDRGQRNRIIELVKTVPGVNSVHADLKY